LHDLISFDISQDMAARHQGFIDDLKECIDDINALKDAEQNDSGGEDKPDEALQASSSSISGGT